MAGNSFGQLFRITTAGESHGKANVVIIDGCPPNISLSESDIQIELDRRRPGQSSITTQRKESDIAHILSGVFEGKTTGTSIAVIVYNEDQRSKDYSNIKDIYRPGHADYCLDKKYGIRDYRGGGRSSARETIGRVVAGAIAQKFLALHGIYTYAFTKQVGDLKAKINYDKISRELIEAHPTRCPDLVAAEKMQELIRLVRSEGDSIGGMSEVLIKGVPAGLGEPVFDKLKSDFAKAIMSIPAVLSFEYGVGQNVATMRGSQNNDCFQAKGNNVLTETNNHGGILGGISSGQDILLRSAIKPTSSLSREQKSIDKEKNNITMVTRGRHDPCLVPRFIPIAEAMVNIILMDHLLRWRAQCFEQYYTQYKNIFDELS